MISNNTEEIELIEYDNEEARLARRRERREAMHRQKEMQLRRRRIAFIVFVLVLIVALGFGISDLVSGIKNKNISKEAAEQDYVPEETESSPQEIVETNPLPTTEELYANSEYGPYAHKYSEEKDSLFEGYKVNYTDSVLYPSDEDVLSTYALLIDADDGNVVASKGGKERINPASMTKIMTVLVAAEHVVNLDDKVLIDISITDYAYSHDCSAVGFAQDEVVTVRDLMYGTILPSGADAALALAEYVAGDQDRFVDMMNAKLEELGLSGTSHFTNCVGIFDQNHYCTLTDMAMIMKAAVENELAREILMAHTYTTSSTKEHPDGITISNWFLRRIEDKDTKGEVLCAKTGFVKESGCCAASYAISDSGKHYICVTADAWSSWRCIYDHVAMYSTYVK